MKIDYVQKFIDFIENYTDEKGNKKYIERLKQLINEGKEKLVVEMPDIYRYDPLLAIKIMNDLFTNDRSLLDTISERLYKLLTVSYNPVNIDKLEIDIPPFARVVFGSYDYDKNLESLSPIAFEGYVGMVGQIEKTESTLKQKIFVIPPPEGAISDNRILLFLMTLKDNLVGKVKPGDRVHIHYVYRRANFYERIAYSFEVVNLAVTSSGLDDVKEVDIDKIISIFTTKVPPDFIDRIIEFVENFRDKQGRFKYRELADKLIANGKSDMYIEKDDIKEYDNELFTISMLNPVDFEVGLRTALSMYVTARAYIKRYLPSDEVKLIEENGKEFVMLTKKYINRLNRVAKENYGLDVYAKLFNGHIEERVVNNVKQEVIVVDFINFVKTLFQVIEKENK